jgi:hypothetical protein
MLNKSLKFLDLPDEDLQFLASSPELSAFTANLIAVTCAAHQRLESKLQQQQSHLEAAIQVNGRLEEQVFYQKGLVRALVNRFDTLSSPRGSTIPEAAASCIVAASNGLVQVSSAEARLMPVAAEPLLPRLAVTSDMPNFQHDFEALPPLVIPEAGANSGHFEGGCTGEALSCTSPSTTGSSISYFSSPQSLCLSSPDIKAVTTFTQWEVPWDHPCPFSLKSPNARGEPCVSLMGPAVAAVAGALPSCKVAAWRPSYMKIRKPD